MKRSARALLVARFWRTSKQAGHAARDRIVRLGEAGAHLLKELGEASAALDAHQIVLVEHEESGHEDEGGEEHVEDGAQRQLQVARAKVVLPRTNERTLPGEEAARAEAAEPGTGAWRRLSLR